MGNRGSFRGLGRGSSRLAAINVGMDGGGSALGTGIRQGFEIPFPATIERVKLRTTDGSTGSIVLDLFRLSADELDAGVTPTSAYSICAQSKPTISGSNRYADETLAGWLNKLAAGDWLFANIDSCSGITRLTLALVVRRYFV